MLSETSRLLYKPWGELRFSAAGDPATDRLYTGQRLERELGLYPYQARFYDPGLGRFVQADPLVPDPGSPLDWDRYAYVRNNPLRYTDPTGHRAEYVPGGAGTCPNALACVYWEDHPQAGRIILPPTQQERRQGGQVLGTSLALVPGLDAGDDLLTLLTGCGYACQLGGEERVGLGGRAWALAGVAVPVSGATLRKALGITDAAFDAHHLIPKSMANHPFVKMAMEAGWNMDHAYNGIALPRAFQVKFLVTRDTMTLFKANSMTCMIKLL